VQLRNLKWIAGLIGLCQADSSAGTIAVTAT